MKALVSKASFERPRQTSWISIALLIVGVLGVSGCTFPYQQSAPSSSGSGTSGASDSAQPPGTPTIVLNAGPQTTASSPYTGTTQPQRVNQVLIYDDPANETGLTIQRATGSGAFTTIASPQPGTQLYNDYNVQPSTQYTYRIKASNSAGDSQWYSQSVTSVGTEFGAFSEHTSGDTFTDESYPSSNYGSSSYVQLSGSSSGYGTSDAFLAFPFPNLPTWATGFYSAELNLLGGPGSYPAITVDAEMIQSSWNESTVTWSSQPTVSTTLASTSGTPTNLNGGTSISLDVSTIVSDWFSGYTDYGIALSVDGSTPSSVWTFDSIEGFQPGSAVIEVEYEW